MSESDLREFEEFWKEYPKKRSKGVAYKAWMQTKEVRPPLSVLFKALAVLKTSNDWVKEGGQFIPYPASWLRAWGWDDVSEVELGEVHNGKMWWETVSGVEMKAKEMNFGEWNPRVDATWKDYADRLKKECEERVGNVINIRESA